MIMRLGRMGAGFGRFGSASAGGVSLGPAETVWEEALTTDFDGYGNYTTRNVVPVTGMADADYLVLIADYGATSDIRGVNGLGDIPTAGATGHVEQSGANSYNSAAELNQAPFGGIVVTFNKVEIRGSGASRQIRVTIEAPDTGNLDIDNASVGIWAGTDSFAEPHRGDTVDTPIELKCSGASGVTASDGAEVPSDWVSFPV